MIRTDALRRNRQSWHRAALGLQAGFRPSGVCSPACLLAANEIMVLWYTGNIVLIIKPESFTSACSNISQFSADVLSEAGKNGGLLLRTKALQPDVRFVKSNDVLASLRNLSIPSSKADAEH